MARPLYLTKSRFKLATECPRKLYYYAHSDEYPNLKHEDDFLMALADGGHQVGQTRSMLLPWSLPRLDVRLRPGGGGDECAA